MRKILTIILSILLISALFAGCTQAVETPSETTAESEVAATTNTDLSLSIASSPSGYNPYLVNDMIVEQTASLLFSNFIEIDPDFNIDYLIAERVTCSGTSVTITIRTGLTFADGTAITAEDALQSLLAAKNSATYAARFSNLLEASVSGNNLILTLSEPDDLFAYLLDIPILKASEVDSTAPTASGQYTYGSDGTYLFINKYMPFEKEGPDIIYLVEVSSYDEMISELALGNINYTTLSEEATGESTSISTSENYYKMNDLIFLGINSAADNPLCNTSEGRVLLSELLDRKELTTSSYYARASSARGAINSYYPCALDTQIILPESDDTNLAQTMEALGYTYNDETGFFETERGAAASVSLLVNSSNTYKTQLATLIAQEWAEYGIEVTITQEADFAVFLSLLETGKFELYIGEVKLYNNIDLSPLWSGDASYGINASESLLSAYSAFRADSDTAAAFEEAFASEMPYIPLMWRNGIVATSRTLSGVSSSLSNPFYSLETLTSTG